MNEYMKKRYLKNKIDKTNKYIENEILKKDLRKLNYIHVEMYTFHNYMFVICSFGGIL